PAGALIHYRLAGKAKEVTLEILEGKEVIRTLTSKKIEDRDPDQGAYSAQTPREPLPTEAGQHRVVWDLRHKGAFTIAGGRVDGGRPDRGPLVNPGEYVVRLTVDGEKHEAKLTVLMEPRLEGKLGKDELKEQLTFLLEIRDSITRLAKAVEELKAVRKQLQAREALLKGDDRAKKLLDESKQLVEK